MATKSWQSGKLVGLLCYFKLCAYAVAAGRKTEVISQVVKAAKTSYP